MENTCIGMEVRGIRLGDVRNCKGLSGGWTREEGRALPIGGFVTFSIDSLPISRDIGVSSSKARSISDRSLNRDMQIHTLIHARIPIPHLANIFVDFFEDVGFDMEKREYRPKDGIEGFVEDETRLQGRAEACQSRQEQYRCSESQRDPGTAVSGVPQVLACV